MRDKVIVEKKQEVLVTLTYDEVITIYYALFHEGEDLELYEKWSKLYDEIKVKNKLNK